MAWSVLPEFQAGSWSNLRSEVCVNGASVFRALPRTHKVPCTFQGLTHRSQLPGIPVLGDTGKHMEWRQCIPKSSIPAP